MKKWSDVEKAQWILENAWTEHKLKRRYLDDLTWWWRKETAPPWSPKSKLGPYYTPVHHGLDIEKEIAAALSAEITAEIDREILETLRANAKSARYK